MFTSGSFKYILESAFSRINANCWKTTEVIATIALNYLSKKLTIILGGKSARDELALRATV